MTSGRRPSVPPAIMPKSSSLPWAKSSGAGFRRQVRPNRRNPGECFHRMSISPPSDIVLDVARAADPVRYSEAAARLTRTAPSAETFANFLSDAATEPAPALPVASVASKKAPANSAEAYEGLVAMALANMIEASMPGDATAVFGSGTAGSEWKSMLAEQLGAQMAKAGGIDLAAQLARSAAQEPQPP